MLPSIVSARQCLVITLYDSVVSQHNTQTCKQAFPSNLFTLAQIMLRITVQYMYWTTPTQNVDSTSYVYQIFFSQPLSRSSLPLIVIDTTVFPRQRFEQLFGLNLHLHALASDFDCDFLPLFPGTQLNYFTYFNIDGLGSSHELSCFDFC